MPYMYTDRAGRAYLQSTFSTALYGALLITLSLRLVWGLFDYDPLGVLASSLALVILSATCLWAARRGTPRLARALLVAQPFIGLIGVSSIVHFSGGINSNFIFLYSIPALSSVWVSGTFAFFTALAAVVSLGALLSAEFSGILPNVAKSGYEASQMIAIHVSRLVLLLSVVLGASLTYTVYMARKHRAYSELQDEAIYRLAQEVPAPRATMILSGLEARTQLTAQRNLAFGAACSSCRQGILPGQTYWGLAQSELDPMELGKYRNDVHCVACHAKGACEICEDYAPTIAREALS